MDIKWLIQRSGFNINNLDLVIESLEYLQLPYDNFGISRMQSHVQNLENILINPEQKFIIRGGTSLLTVLSKVTNLKDVNYKLSEEQISNSNKYIGNLKDGIFYDVQSFDQNFYGKFDLPLLNNEFQSLSVKDNLNTLFMKDMFIKPSRDLKAFDGGILEAGYTIKEFIFSQQHKNFYIDEIAIFAEIKKIYAEYRFFIVNQEVITSSQYKSGGNPFISETVPDNINEAAKEYAKLYQPHDIFTMDLADTPNGIKIVEYNCWNASNLYKTNIPKIFDAVQEFQKFKWENNHSLKI